MKKIIVMSLLIVLLSGCNKAEMGNDGYEIFVINKGDHASYTNIIPTKDSVLTFTALFDSTAIYSVSDSQNLKDVNKLFGMTDCGLLNHINSARIGWRWYKDSLQLFAYAYSNTKRTIQYMTTAKIGREIRCSITASQNKYIFRVNEATCVLERECDQQTDRFMQYPYFGGDELAPHQVVIKIAY